MSLGRCYHCASVHEHNLTLPCGWCNGWMCPAHCPRPAEHVATLARAAEGALDALLDGIVTPDEVEAIRKDADAAVVLAENAVGTLEVAAGKRLL